MMRILESAVLVLHLLLSIGYVVFSLFVIVKILASKGEVSVKIKKLALSLPAAMLSVVLVFISLEILTAIEGLSVFFYLIISIPTHISFIGLIYLISRILKGNTIIKNWSSGFKMAYITICIIALLYFVWATSIIIFMISNNLPFW